MSKKYEITKSINADSRTAESFLKEDLKIDTLHHINDVQAVMGMAVEELTKRARKHDHTKLDYFEEFYKDWIEDRESFNFTDGEWYKKHINEEKHHSGADLHVDYNLFDMIEEIVDKVVAGVGRTGEVNRAFFDFDEYTVRLAIMNTINFFEEQVELKEEKNLKVDLAKIITEEIILKERKCGYNFGGEFREEYLKPALDSAKNSGVKVELNLDGIMSLPVSFMCEAFIMFRIWTQGEGLEEQIEVISDCEKLKTLVETLLYIDGTYVMEISMQEIMENPNSYVLTADDFKVFAQDKFTEEVFRVNDIGAEKISDTMLELLGIHYSFLDIEILEKYDRKMSRQESAIKNYKEIKGCGEAGKNRFIDFEEIVNSPKRYELTASCYEVYSYDRDLAIYQEVRGIKAEELNITELEESGINFSPYDEDILLGIVGKKVGD